MPKDTALEYLESQLHEHESLSSGFSSREGTPARRRPGVPYDPSLPQMAPPHHKSPTAQGFSSSNGFTLPGSSQGLQQPSSGFSQGSEAISPSISLRKPDLTALVGQLNAELQHCMVPLNISRMQGGSFGAPLSASLPAQLPTYGSPPGPVQTQLPTQSPPPQLVPQSPRQSSPPPRPMVSPPKLVNQDGDEINPAELLASPMMSQLRKREEEEARNRMVLSPALSPPLMPRAPEASRGAGNTLGWTPIPMSPPAPPPRSPLVTAPATQQPQMLGWTPIPMSPPAPPPRSPLATAPATQPQLQSPAQSCSTHMVSPRLSPRLGHTSPSAPLSPPVPLGHMSPAAPLSPPALLGHTSPVAPSSPPMPSICQPRPAVSAPPQTLCQQRSPSHSPRPSYVPPVAMALGGSLQAPTSSRSTMPTWAQGRSASPTRALSHSRNSFSPLRLPSNGRPHPQPSVISQRGTSPSPRAASPRGVTPRPMPASPMGSCLVRRRSGQETTKVASNGSMPRWSEAPIAPPMKLGAMPSSVSPPAASVAMPNADQRGTSTALTWMQVPSSPRPSQRASPASPRRASSPPRNMKSPSRYSRRQLSGSLGGSTTLQSQVAGSSGGSSVAFRQVASGLGGSTIAPRQTSAAGGYPGLQVTSASGAPTAART